MRELSEVIDKLLQVVPQSEQNLIAGLQDIRSSATFAPPEGMGTWWAEAASLLNECIGSELVEPWHKDVHAIFSGEHRTIYNEENAHT